MKAHQLQAAFARRREMAHQRAERTEAVNRYYDHWGKVTSRFENWTTPAYYAQAEEQLQQTRQRKAKAQRLEERREKLRVLLAAESAKLEAEMRERERPRSRSRAHVATETLARIEQQAREREQIKRKLDLEAKLYGRWRHGVDDEHLIFESKSDNQVLAKLNWLDKQVEEQLEREREEAQAEERRLRLQEELRRTEQTQKERQQIREQELREIRALQERHMDQLRERQRESDALKEQEAGLRAQQAELEKELELLTESAAVVALAPAEVSQAYNLKKIKVFIRKRSEVFRNQIQLTIELLRRLRATAADGARVRALLERYVEQQAAEAASLAQIEAMYESEAKYNLQRCEELWQAQHLERQHEVRQLLRAEQAAVAARLGDNLERQGELIEVRATHLASIEASNEQLKQLALEQADSPRVAPPTEGSEAAEASEASVERSESGARPPSGGRKTSVPPLGRGSSALPKVTNSFCNLNLDVWQDLPSARGGIDSPRLQSQRSLQVVTPDTAERPRFARKRVAWT